MLPFETHGMDGPVPTIDFSPTGNTEAVYSFERSDVERAYPVPSPYHSPLIHFNRPLDLLRVLTDLETYAQTRLNKSPIALDAVRNCRASLDKLITKMDALEAAFDKIAERSRE